MKGMTAVTTTVMVGTDELVASAREGDSDAFAQLVLKYERLVWAVVRSFRLSHADANDALQITWLRLIENIHQLRDPDRLGSWLATTCKRECLRLVASKDREVSGLDECLAEQVETLVSTPEQQAIDNTMATALWEQVAGLPIRAQTLLRALISHDAPSYAEISRQLGMPIGSIGPSRGRYLRQLRAHMEQNGLGQNHWR